MSSGMSMLGFDVFFRFTDKEGHSWVEERRAWDADALSRNLSIQYQKEGGQCVRISREDYEKERERRTR